TTCNCRCPPCLVLLTTLLFNATPTSDIYTLSLHDALPISRWPWAVVVHCPQGSPVLPYNLLYESRLHLHHGEGERQQPRHCSGRSEEHTSELQSHLNLVCRLLLEKKKTTTKNRNDETRSTT